jgi:threonine aldolase
MKLFMDGARFANAVASGVESPAALTWRAGVDALSFGATKNGAMAAEALIFFHSEDAPLAEFHRKRSGHSMVQASLFGGAVRCLLAGRALAYARIEVQRQNGSG